MPIDEEVRLGIRLSPDERRMLDELAQDRYPEGGRAHSMLIRRLIRDEYERKKKRDKAEIQQS